jgi:hypothetical protein
MLSGTVVQFCSKSLKPCWTSFFDYIC